MFSKVKQLFKERKNKKKDMYQTTESVSLRDLTGKKITLEIKTNGNNTMLLIRDKDETQTLFTLDQETALLLNVLLQSYSLHGVFPDLEDKKED
jgi:hypothetical protein